MTLLNRFYENYNAKIFCKYLSAKKSTKVADLSVTESVTHPSESLLGLRVSGNFSLSPIFIQRISHPLSSVGYDRIIAAIQSLLSVSADEECCISVKCYYYCKEIIILIKQNELKSCLQMVILAIQKSKAHEIDN